MSAERATVAANGVHQPHIRITGLSKQYGKQGPLAVKDLNLEIGRGGFFGLVGPSGCGKTTTLQMLTGFVPPSSGDIEVSGKSILSVPAYKRGIAMMFQSYALFPHMTAHENVGFGLKVRRWKQSALHKRVEELLELVDLAGSGHKLPRQMSGGQQQRVALARALAIEPEVILLDEPLSNLDAKLRSEMRRELLRVLRDTGVTVVLVTHDQSEAFALCDRIALMFGGEVEAVADPESMYQRPPSIRAAEFIGESCLLPAEYIEAASEATAAIRLQLPGRPVIDCARTHRSHEPGQVGIALIRPECIRVTPARSGDADTHAVTGRVTDRTYGGEIVNYDIQVGSVSLTVREFAHSSVVRPGDDVLLHWEDEHVLFFPGRISATAPMQTNASAFEPSPTGTSAP